MTKRNRFYIPSIGICSIGLLAFGVATVNAAETTDEVQSVAEQQSAPQEQGFVEKAKQKFKQLMGTDEAETAAAQAEKESEAEKVAAEASGEGLLGEAKQDVGELAGDDEPEMKTAEMTEQLEAETVATEEGEESFLDKTKANNELMGGDESESTDAQTTEVGAVTPEQKENVITSTAEPEQLKEKAKTELKDALPQEEELKAETSE